MVRRESDISRNFASKVYAVRMAVASLNGTKYDFIGNLDADITFQHEYYERLLEIFKKNPRLGIGGGIAVEPHDGKWLLQRTNIEWSVGGYVQMFRRQCYHDIDGYLPLPKGGEDAIAEVMARKCGWQVRTFPQLQVYHHRETGTANEGFYSSRISLGVHHYSLGYTSWFELARCLSRMRPGYIFGELLTLYGYVLAFLRRDEIAVPEDIRNRVREEQVGRLKKAFHVRRSKD